MRGYVRCERCDWSRIYATFSVARIPIHCPACGRRVVRERTPTETSPVITQWRAVADRLAPPPGQPPSPPAG
jgi:DNA-directed RNA polymerase subunit RPC12/RpoP